MKKCLLILFMVLLVCSCKKNEDKKEEVKILSTGELVCGYKEQRVNENVIYTSVHVFNYNKNGILVDVKNIESVEFDGTLESVREKYKKALEEDVNNYKDIKGISVEKNLEKSKYSFEVNINKDEISEELKDKFLLTYDRKTVYKIFTADGYSCE